MVSRRIGEENGEVPVVRRVRRWLEERECGVAGAVEARADVRVLARRLEELAARVPALAARVSLNDRLESVEEPGDPPDRGGMTRADVSERTKRSASRV